MAIKPHKKSEFQRLASEVARAALGAELEYLRWTREYSVIDSGCEPLISSSVARAASAFYGINDDIEVFLEEPISEIAKYGGWKTEAGERRRLDCAIYNGLQPWVVIECKRIFFAGKIERDVDRCIELLKAKPRKLQCAMIVGLRGIHDSDRADRAESATRVKDGFAARYPEFQFDVATVDQELTMPVKYKDKGKSRTWTAAMAACLSITGG